MSQDEEIDRADAFGMTMSGMRFVTEEEAQAILAARAAEDVERLARRTRRMAAEEASKKKTPGRRSRPVAETAKANEKTQGGP